MKIKNSILFVAITGGIVMGCSKKPSADFSMDDDTPVVGQRVYFTSESINASTYDWDFGDGYFSTGETPSHEYNTAGTYTVTLTASNWNGKKTDSYGKTITVMPSTFELMTDLWDYNTFKTVSYIDGEFDSESTTNLGDVYDTHTIEFLTNYTYKTTLDGSVNEGSWTLNTANNTFVVDGETYTILLLNSGTFNFASKNTYTSGGSVHLDSTYAYLSR